MAAPARNYANLVGKKLNMLTFIREVNVKTDDGFEFVDHTNPYYEAFFKCDCGATTRKRIHNWTNNKVKSCGCARGKRQLDAVDPDLARKRGRRIVVDGHALADWSAAGHDPNQILKDALAEKPPKAFSILRGPRKRVLTPGKEQT